MCRQMQIIHPIDSQAPCFRCLKVLNCLRCHEIFMGAGSNELENGCITMHCDAQVVTERL